MWDTVRAMFYPLPKKGEIYEFSDNSKDPWETRKHKVEVLDVKDGWVRYRFCFGTMWQDERLPRSSFNFCYKKEST